MAWGQKGVSIVMCVERVIGNLMDSANGFHAPKPDLDVKQENNNRRNNKVFDQFFIRFKFPQRIHFHALSFVQNYLENLFPHVFKSRTWTKNNHHSPVNLHLLPIVIIFCVIGNTFCYNAAQYVIHAAQMRSTLTA